ncbi:MAG: oligosaccharide flippase family protein [Actinomycetota bacterium]
MEVASTAPSVPPSPQLARDVAVSAGTQLGARVLHLGLNLVSSLVIVRSMGPSSYGRYVLVITLATFLGLLADFGLAKLAVREIARDPGAEPEVLGTTILLRLALAAVAAALVQAGLAALSAPGEVRAAGAVASALFVTESLLSLVVTFHVRMKQQYEALVRVVMEALETGLVIWLVARSASLVQLVAAPVVGATAGVVIAGWAVRRRFGVRLRFDARLARRLMAAALPVGPALLLGAAYLKLGGVILAARATPREVGIYGAAFQPIEYLLLATAVLINVLYPLLARWHGAEPGTFLAVYRRGSEWLLAATLPVPILLAFTAGPVVSFVFEPRFAASAGPLRLLSVALVLMSVSAWQSFVLLAGGRQRVALVYDGVALAFTGLLGVLLVPSLGAAGAAIATLAGSLVVAAWSTIASSRLLGATLDGQGLARVGAAGAGLAVTMAVLRGAGVTWWAAMVVAAASYPMWLRLAGILKTGELRAMLSRHPAAPTPVGEGA